MSPTPPEAPTPAMLLKITLQNCSTGQWTQRTSIGGQEARLRKELRLVCVNHDVLGLKVFERMEVAFANARTVHQDLTINVIVEELEPCPQRTPEKIEVLVAALHKCIDEYAPGNTVNFMIKRHASSFPPPAAPG